MSPRASGVPADDRRRARTPVRTALRPRKQGLFGARSHLAWTRRQKKRLFTELRDQNVGLRRTVRGRFVGPDLMGLGFAKHTPREPVGLARQARALGRSFQRGDLGPWLGTPLFPGVPFEAKLFGKQLAEGGKDLFTAINDEAEATAAETTAIVERDEAMRDYDQLYLPAARLLEDFCRFAGRPEVAAKIRPSARTRVSSQADAEADAADGTKPSAKPRLRRQAAGPRGRKARPGRRRGRKPRGAAGRRRPKGRR